MKHTLTCILLLTLYSCTQIPLDHGLSQKTVVKLDEDKAYIRGIILSDQEDKLLYWDGDNDVYQLDLVNPNSTHKYLFRIKSARFGPYYGDEFIENIDNIPAEWSNFSNYLKKIKSAKGFGTFGIGNSKALPAILPNSPLIFLDYDQVSPVYIRKGDKNALLKYDSSRKLASMMTNSVTHSLDMKTWIVATSSYLAPGENANEDFDFKIIKNRNNKLLRFSVSQADLDMQDRHITEISSTLSPSGKWAVVFMQSTLSNRRVSSFGDFFYSIGNFFLNKNVLSMALIDVENESIIWKKRIGTYGFQLPTLPNELVFNEKQNVFYFLNEGEIKVYKLP